MGWGLGTRERMLRGYTRPLPDIAGFAAGSMLVGTVSAAAVRVVVWSSLRRVGVVAVG